MLSRPLVRSVVPTVGAALLGNAFVGRESMAWFRGLRRPRWDVPMPAFVAVALVYYLQLGVVSYRAAVRRDRRAYQLSLVVLAGNELWNAVFFGRRSPRAGFAGVLVFCLPLGLLQRAVAHDPVSARVLAPYTAWVVLYDVPWAYALHRLNPEG